MDITPEDLGNAIEGALAMLPEDSPVYHMEVSTEFDDSGLLSRPTCFPLRSEPFTKEENEAFKRLIEKVTSEQRSPDAEMDNLVAEHMTELYEHGF